MILCKKCNGRVFVDRMYSAENHIEVFCIICGKRKFYHNWGPENKEAQWLLEIEKKKSKTTMSQL